MILLSIVMAALAQRHEGSRMLSQLHEQTKDRDDVEFFVLLDNGPLSTGTKLNLLYPLCKGKYVCQVADDDVLADDYIEVLTDAIKKHDGVDVITFEHTYNVDGALVAITYQTVRSIERQVPGEPEEHLRKPGVLCPVRREIACGFTYPPVSDMEDIAYKDYITERVKTSHDIRKVLYHHMYGSHNKKERLCLKRKWHRD